MSPWTIVCPHLDVLAGKSPLALLGVDMGNHGVLDTTVASREQEGALGALHSIGTVKRNLCGPRQRG